MKKTMMAVLSAGLACAVLSGCDGLGDPSFKMHYSSERITATVTDKQYVAPYTTYISIMTGKTTQLIPDYHPAEYETTFQYGGVQTSSDDEGIYQKYNLHDHPVMYLINGYDEHGNMVNQELTLNPNQVAAN